MDEYLKLQLQQAIETYRWQYSLMIQIGTLLMMADAAVIWHVIISEGEWKKPFIWLIGASLPSAALAVLLATAPLMKPVLYTAVSIEQTQRHCADQTPAAACAPYDGLASTLISTTYSRQNYIESLEHAANGKDLNTRRAALHELHSPYDFCTLIWKTWTGWVLLQILVAQVLAAPFFVGPGTFKWTCWRIALAVFFGLEVLVTGLCYIRG